MQIPKLSEGVLRNGRHRPMTDHAFEPAILPQGCHENVTARHIKCVDDGILGEDLCGSIAYLGHKICDL
jgi:hypothetical protein